MKLNIYSYRYAQEILQHPNNVNAWDELCDVLQEAPLFIYPEKSKKKRSLFVVQQLMNTYFDRRFAVDCGWQYHPLATGIIKSKLAADFRKSFGPITIQAEVQFGNMARWYSDIFKLQAAYSQSLIQCGVCVVPCSAMARVIDSNVAHYERAVRELPSANLSITLPILLVGLEQDDGTKVVDVSVCKFSGIKEITGRGKNENRYRIINAYVSEQSLDLVDEKSPTGALPEALSEDEDEEDEESE